MKSLFIIVAVVWLLGIRWFLDDGTQDAQAIVTASSLFDPSAVINLLSLIADIAAVLGVILSLPFRISASRRTDPDERDPSC